MLASLCWGGVVLCGSDVMTVATEIYCIECYNKIGLMKQVCLAYVAKLFVQAG